MVASLKRETVEWQIPTNESNSAGRPDFRGIPSMLRSLFELRLRLAVFPKVQRHLLSPGPP